MMLKVLTLLAAAMLEVGGDALIRKGLGSRGIPLMIAGVVVLGIYGFTVNLTKLDFGRLMGLYIVLFFLVSQAVSVGIFKERLQLPTIVGGSLIAAGGVVMLVWRAAQ